MKCREFKNLMDEYLDGELPEGTQGKIRSHLSECPVCRSAYERRKKLFSMMHTSSGFTWSEDLVEEIMDKIQKQRIPVESSYRTPLIIAACVTFSIWALIFFFGIGSILDSGALQGFVKALGSFIELPRDMQNNLLELQQFIQGWFLAAKAVWSGLGTIFSHLLKYLMLPALLLGLVIAGILVRLTLRQTKSM